LNTGPCFQSRVSIPTAIEISTAILATSELESKFYKVRKKRDS